MDKKTNAHPLTDFKELLISSNLMSIAEAEVYLLLVDMGQATATNVHYHLNNKLSLKRTQQAVHKILIKLRKNGFINSTVTSGKRKHSTYYRANSPEYALKGYFEKVILLKDLSNEVVAKLELNEQKGTKEIDQQIWLYEPKKIAIREGINQILKAKKSIDIYCNDYTWVQNPDIEDALSKKITNGLNVRVLGEKPIVLVKKILEDISANRRETKIPCSPYCLIDYEQLLLFFCEGLENRLIVTKNLYMVKRHSAQFEEIWKNHSIEV